MNCIILNCPCCGSKAVYKEIILSESGTHFAAGQVKCTNKECGLQTDPKPVKDYWYWCGTYNTPEEIINIWNKRFDDEKLSNT